MITSALRREPRPAAGRWRSTSVTLESIFFQRQEQVFALIQEQKPPESNPVSWDRTPDESTADVG